MDRDILVRVGADLLKIFLIASLPMFLITRPEMYERGVMGMTALAPKEAFTRSFCVRFFLACTFCFAALTHFGVQTAFMIGIVIAALALVIGLATYERAWRRHASKRGLIEPINQEG